MGKKKKIYCANLYFLFPISAIFYCVFSGFGQSSDEYEDLEEDRVAESMKSALQRALQQSGFAGRSSDGSSNVLPCPLGTFVNSSEIGHLECKMCPPGNFVDTTKLIKSLEQQASFTVSKIKCKLQHYLF